MIGAPGGGPLDRVYYSHYDGTDKRSVKSTVRELRSLVATGALDKSVMVWTFHMTEWMPLMKAAYDDKQSIPPPLQCDLQGFISKDCVSQVVPREALRHAAHCNERP